MTDGELAFWTTAAQLSVVLALALVVDVGVVYGNGRAIDAGWKSYKLFAISQVVSTTASISIAFVTCIRVLSSGVSTPSQINSVSWALITGFGVLVVAGALEVIVRIAIHPVNPVNPEPQGLRGARPAPEPEPVAPSEDETPPAPISKRKKRTEKKRP